jgi:hypothetical protein
MNDVTAIVAYDENEQKVLDIYVPWEDTPGSEFGGPNLWQKNKWEDKALTIEWSKDGKL